jgi:hypothetical protein
MNAKFLKSAGLALMLGGLAACSSQKEPATQALAGVENSVAGIKADAQRFASERYAAVQKDVADLRASYDKKDYKTVVTNAPAVQKEVSELRDTTAAHRKEFEETTARATTAWNGFADEMPRYLETLQKKVDAKPKRRSDKGAPSEDALLLTNVRNLWADAGNLFTTGKPVEATARAEQARAKAQELAQKIGAKLD